MTSHNSDTYEKPEHGWTCFHCGETFTTIGHARDHFGAKPDAVPGCIERVQLGEERGLLMSLRKVETQLAHCIDENAKLHQTIDKMHSKHVEQLKIAEETGYERGLKDSQNESNIYDLIEKISHK